MPAEVPLLAQSSIPFPAAVPVKYISPPEAVRLATEVGASVGCTASGASRINQAAFTWLGSPTQLRNRLRSNSRTAPVVTAARME